MAESIDSDQHALKLLVVEDEAIVAMLVEDALSLHGHEVVGVADSMASAVEAVEAARPDLALCDVRLADGDSGVDVAEALAARGIPCLYLSGNCPQTRSHPLILGCVAKPFHTAGLGLAVRAAHARATGHAVELPAGMTFY